MRKKCKTGVIILFLSVWVLVPKEVAAGTWIQTGSDWQYQEDVGNLVKNSWKQISGKWYKFNHQGVMLKGWQKDKNNWYYLDNSGVMKTGWQKDKNNWYYLDNLGVMKTGWLKDKKNWYYLDNSGVMKKGWQKSKKNWYYLDNSGVMKTGWLKDKNRWYYLDESGSMQTGWLKKNNRWYFLNSEGVMQTGWVKDRSQWYYFDRDGVMQTGWLELGEDFYYLDDKGAMYTDRWKGNYYLKSDGRMARLEYTPDGFYVNDKGLYDPKFQWILQKGQEVQHKYFTFYIPVEWNGLYRYREISRSNLGYEIWGICYKDAIAANGFNNTYDFFYIVQCKSLEARQAALEEMKGALDLGYSKDKYYLLCTPKESNIDLFSEQQQIEINRMQEYLPSIMRSVKIR